MDFVLFEICVLVTAAFTLSLVPGVRSQDASLLSVWDRGKVLLVFLILGLLEELTGRQHSWINERIVAVSAAGLVAGAEVGLIVSVFVTWLAVQWDGLPLVGIGVSMVGAGLAGGYLHRWRSELAQRPLTGFCFAASISLIRDGLTLLDRAPETLATVEAVERIGIMAAAQGLGVALILKVQAIAKDRETRIRAAVLAERARLSRELHDTLGRMLIQTLWLIESLEADRSAVQAPALRSGLQQAAAALRQSLIETHNCVRALRDAQIEHTGSFLAALEKTMRSCVQGSDLIIALQSSGTPFLFGEAIEQLLIRVTQEAVCNTRKHTRATRIQATLVYEKRSFTLMLEDDGVGSDMGKSVPDALWPSGRKRSDGSGVGLQGLRERCQALRCKMTVESKIGSGFVIKIRGRRPPFSYIRWNGTAGNTSSEG